MAISVPTAQAAATKWSTRAQSAGPDYKSGVINSGQLWQERTSASGPIWASQVQAAIANGRFESSVAGKASEYQNMASTKGVANYPGGITAGANKYLSQAAKVLQVISGVVLPPSGPRNSPMNYARSVAVGNALAAAKMQGNFN